MNIIENDRCYFGFKMDTTNWGVRICLDVDKDFHDNRSYDFIIQVLCFAVVFGIK